MSDHAPSALSSVIEAFQEGREQARRERAARQLHYDKQLVENFSYSPRQFYVQLAKALEDRRVPGLTSGLVGLFESVPGSSKRLYMTIARERFVYYVCAAPFGAGFFFSWRLVDERRPGNWLHFFVMMAVLLGMTGVASLLFFSPITGLLSTLGYDTPSIVQIIPFLPLTIFALSFATGWSFMRCAANPGYESLASFVEQIPVVGRVFERFFRPDTYFRHDSQEMFKKVFENALQETVTAITTSQAIRQREMPGGPCADGPYGK